MAGFSLTEFMANNQDFARAYTFYVKIFHATIATDPATYLVRGSSLPTSTIDEVTTSWQGMAYKLGSTHTYDTFTVTFNSDVDDNLRQRFATWSEMIHNGATNIHGLPATYMGIIDVEHVSHTLGGGTIMAYKLIGAWPSLVSELTLAYDNKDVATFDVTFTYQYHIPL